MIDIKRNNFHVTKVILHIIRQITPNKPIVHTICCWTLTEYIEK